MSDSTQSIRWMCQQVMALQQAHGSIEERETSIVPSVFGDSLYDARQSAMGRFWTWSYREIWHLDLAFGLQERAMTKAAKKLHQAWMQTIGSLKEAMRHFEEGSRQALGSLSNYSQVKKDFLALHDLLKEAFPGDQEELLRSRLQKIDVFFRTSGQVCAIEPPLQARALFISAYENWLLLNIEQKTGSDLPRLVLYKLAVGGALQEEEKEQCNRFIEGLCVSWREGREEKKLKIRDLHRALLHLCQHLQLERRSLGKMERALDLLLRQKDCFVFEDKDPIHHEWAKHLAIHGGNLPKNQSGERVQLGPKMKSEKSLAREQHIVFEVVGDPEHVLIIGTRNEAQILIEQEIRSTENWGLPLPDRVLLEDGIAAFEERLKESPRQFLWNSEREEYAAYNAGMVAFLNHLLALKDPQDRPIMPKDLRHDYVAFDKKGQLKYKRLFAQQAFDFEQVRAFVEDCAGHSNLLLYSYWMASSKLSNHEVAQIYHKAMELALQSSNNKQLEQELEKLEAFPDPYRLQYLAKARKLTYDICNLRNMYEEELQRVYLCLGQSAKQMLSLKMMALQKDKGAVGIVLREDKAKLLRHCAKNLYLEMVTPEVERRLPVLFNSLREKTTLKEAEERKKPFQTFLKELCYEQGIFSKAQIQRDIYPYLLRKWKDSLLQQ